MLYRISKEFHFSASHQLEGLREGHPCGRLHGHNYIVVVELEANNLNSVGFVEDFGEMDPIKKWIDTELDHRHLNQSLLQYASHHGVDIRTCTTSENLASIIYWEAQRRLSLGVNARVSAVCVSETPKTWAEYRP